MISAKKYEPNLLCLCIDLITVLHISNAHTACGSEFTIIVPSSVAESSFHSNDPEVVACELKTHFLVPDVDGKTNQASKKDLTSV